MPSIIFLDRVAQEFVTIEKMKAVTILQYLQK